MTFPPSKILATLSCGVAVVIYSVLFFEGSARSYRLWYYVPAAIVAGAFCVDRYRAGWIGCPTFSLDLIVGICCLMRPIFSYPPFSGHAVFSVYVLLTCPFWSTRSLATALLAITLYAKLVLWKGDPTLIPGLWVGLAAGLTFLFLKVYPRKKKGRE